MRRLKLRSESGRIWAGVGGVLLMAVSAFMVATLAFSTDSTAGKVQVAEASHDLVTIEQLEEFAEEGNASVTFCHTEGTGDQHIITTNINAFINDAGHFDADGNPQHEANGVHDFIISVEVDGTVTVFNDETCGAATATATATNTAVATATQPIATATQQVEATETPAATSTTAAATNTPVPTATTASVLGVQATATAAPTSTQIAQALGVQATPRPAVRTLPATGSGGGDQDNSMILLVGLGMILAGTSVSLVALKRRA